MREKERMCGFIPILPKKTDRFDQFYRLFCFYFASFRYFTSIFRGRFPRDLFEMSVKLGFVRITDRCADLFDRKQSGAQKRTAFFDAGADQKIGQRYAVGVFKQSTKI